jgi:hypothetical protein
MNLYAVIALWGLGVRAWFVQGSGDRSVGIASLWRRVRGGAPEAASPT